MPVTQTLRIGRHRRRLALVVAVLVLSLSLGWLSRQAEAQLGLPAQVMLDREDQAEDVGPYMYRIFDPDRKLTFPSVIERFNIGQRGSPLIDRIVSLGVDAEPQWMIFLVRNQTQNEDWVLTFGEHFDGRNGVLAGLVVYDHISGKTYVDTETQGLNTTIAGARSLPPHIPVTIGRNQRAQFVVYVIPKPGIPVTLNPKLVSERQFAAERQGLYNHNRLYPLFMLGLSVFFLAAAVMNRIPGVWLFVLHSLALTAAFSVQNGILYTSFPLSNDLLLVMYLLSVVTGLFMARTFLAIDPGEQIQNRGIFMLTTFAGLGAILMPLAIPSDMILKPLALVFPGLAGSAFIIVLSLAQAYNGQAGARLFALAWFASITGMVVQIVILGSGGASGGWFLSACWTGFMVQGFLLLGAFFARHRAMQHELLRTQEEEYGRSGHLSALRQTKESRENARLQRLIEHERNVMNELREREMEQKAQMRLAKDMADEANRAKSAFLAVVSHEIRTPMTGIMGMVRLLLDSNLSRDQYNYAQTIQDSGDAMLSLLNDILDFEKIESGKLDLERVDFDLHRLVNGILMLMSGHAEAKGISLKVDLGDDVPRYVIGDPVRLRQVLLNLTGNSIKFTDKGGVTLRVQIDASVQKSQGGLHHIRFGVEDTGIGISPEAQRNLFNPFAQADSTITRKFGGTGLGLAISQKLINAMGGAIQIESVEQSGSTFFFTLGLQQGRADMIEEGLGPRQLQVEVPQTVLKVLVVEDNEINQRLLKEFVQRLGHEVTLSGSGEDALAQIEHGHFNMVLMDVELPGMSGMGTTKAIRALADSAKASLPVIALTGRVRDEEIRACFAANMNGYLSKPVDPKRLKDMLQKVIEGRLDNPVEIQQPDGQSAFSAAPVTTNMMPELSPSLSPDLDEDADMTEDIDSFLNPEGLDDFSDDSFETALKDFEENPLRAALAKAEADRAAAAVDMGVFDPSLLTPLRQTMPPADMQAMIDSLFDKSDELVALLNKADMSGDTAYMLARSHELKGMSGNFGLKEMTTLAADAERALRDGDRLAFAMLVEKMPTALAKAKAAVSAWMVV